MPWTLLSYQHWRGRNIDDYLHLEREIITTVFQERGFEQPSSPGWCSSPVDSGMTGMIHLYWRVPGGDREVPHHPVPPPHAQVPHAPDGGEERCVLKHHQ